MFFFFHDTATTEIYTLSLHDALPIFSGLAHSFLRANGVSVGDGSNVDVRSCGARAVVLPARDTGHAVDRKSTRLNSSHSQISYAVFCLKKKKKHITISVQSYRSKEIQ